MSEQLKQKIRERLPGTACRTLYEELGEGMTPDEFRLIFIEAANHEADNTEAESVDGIDA